MSPPPSPASPIKSEQTNYSETSLTHTPTTQLESISKLNVPEPLAPGPEVGTRLESVHALRGLAALSVALYHFGSGNPSFYVPKVLKTITSYGWLGIEVFFVISGFILPYSLWKAGYTLSLQNVKRFVWKRVARLDPPYLVTIAIVLTLAFSSPLVPGFRGEPFHFSLKQLALHVGYLNGIAGVPWLNPAFWTLAVEFQFYLLLAFVYPFVSSPAPGTRRAGVMLLLALSFAYHLVGGGSTVLNFLPLFCVGILGLSMVCRP